MSPQSASSHTQPTPDPELDPESDREHIAWRKLLRDVTVLSVVPPVVAVCAVRFLVASAADDNIFLALGIGAATSLLSLVRIAMDAIPFWRQNVEPKTVLRAVGFIYVCAFGWQLTVATSYLISSIATGILWHNPVLILFGGGGLCLGALSLWLNNLQSRKKNQDEKDAE